MQKKALAWIQRVTDVIVLAVLAVSCTAQEPLASRLVVQASPLDIAGFARADGPRSFQFPEDHGPHLDFQTEWWYYTGNLETPAGRHFGFQLTFFRRALLPPGQRARRSSDWATDQVYMAHFALTDVSGGRYQAFERLSRRAAGLAGAVAQTAPPFDVWLYDWQVKSAYPAAQDADGTCNSPQAIPCEYHLAANNGDITLSLDLVDRKGPILQGEHGYSRKGSDRGQASYYYSLTRLETSGEVVIGGQQFQVRGWSWMDHEFSTSALSQDQVGWDWFSIQLDDDSELMVYQIRQAGGGLDPFSSGTLVEPDGTVIHLKREDFQIQVESTWKSPHSGAVYPAQWTVRLPAYDLELKIRPYLADQELNVSYAYWEGAVHVEGQRDGKIVQGSGYVELTGYSGSMGGQF